MLFRSSTEITIGHVDGDALLALDFEAIDQQRVIERFALAAMAPAIGRQRRELVVVEAARIVHQASDQRALAIIDAAAGDESQPVAGPVLAQVGGTADPGVHAPGAPPLPP